MTDEKRNMTVEHILKALVCCKNNDCDNCPNTFGNCMHNLCADAIDLIERQKIEIEYLNNIQADLRESLRLASEANKDMAAELSALKKDYEKAVDFIKYLDRNYSSYMTEDERFENWTND